jgi:hypothetical protein
MLKDAVAKGYKNVALLRKDKDMDSLREREDFKRLLAELEAKYPQSPTKSEGKPEDNRKRHLRLAVAIVAGWAAVR